MEWLYLSVATWISTDIMFDESIIIEPPKPIIQTEYKCDKIFHVNSILSLYNQPQLCGLVWVNGQDTSFYTIDMTSFDSNKIDNRSTRLKKHNKGGQSAARFSRLHQESVVKYLKDIAADTRDHFEDDNIKTVIIGGNGKKKDQLVPYLHTDISGKIIGNIILTEKDTISDAYQKMLICYKDHQIKEEERNLNYFTTQIEYDTGKAIYGLEIVKDYLKNGYLQRVYIDRNYYEDKIYQIEKICKKYGCEMFLIGNSCLGQTLSQNYGNMFGVSWFIIEN